MGGMPPDTLVVSRSYVHMHYEPDHSKPDGYGPEVGSEGMHHRKLWEFRLLLRPLLG